MSEELEFQPLPITHYQLPITYYLFPMRHSLTKALEYQFNPNL